MPELPEVQVVINYLNTCVLNQEIIDVEVSLVKLLKNISVKQFKKEMIHHSFKKIYRRGKFLLFVLDNDKVMVSHLRMEGKYNYQEHFTKDKHDHLWWVFKNGSVLKYNDSRQFGTINFYENEELALNSPELKKLGVEPFSDEFNLDYYYQAMHSSKKPLKTFLLDQSKVVGIGNIYANEICFATHIDPRTLAYKLKKPQVQAIIDATKFILEESISFNGTTIHSFTFSKWKPGSYQEKLQIYDRLECVKCHQPIEFFKLNQRGTYCCKKCQKKY